MVHGRTDWEQQRSYTLVLTGITMLFRNVLMTLSTEPDDTAGEEDSIPLNAEDIIANGLATGTISDACDVSVTMWPMDTDEDRLIHEFAQHGCTCDHGYDRTPCCKSFTEDHYLSFRCAFTLGPSVAHQQDIVLVQDGCHMLNGEVVSIHGHLDFSWCRHYLTIPTLTPSII